MHSAWVCCRWGLFLDSKEKVIQLSSSDFPKVPRPQAPSRSTTPPPKPRSTLSPKPLETVPPPKEIEKEEKVARQVHADEFDSFLFALFTETDRLDCLFKEKNNDTEEAKQVRCYLRQIKKELEGDRGKMNPELTAKMYGILLREVEGIEPLHNKTLGDQTIIGIQMIPALQKLLQIGVNEIQSFDIFAPTGLLDLDDLLRSGEVWMDLDLKGIKESEPEMVFFNIRRPKKSEGCSFVQVPTECTLRGVEYFVRGGLFKPRTTNLLVFR